jgi:cytidine deaminase
MMDPIEALVSAARSVRNNAYAPYSRYKVGAALLDEQGRVHVGCNVENSAYPQGVCAEASAIASMVAAGGTRIVTTVVVGEGPRPGAPCMPCGGCRQKLREFASDDMPVIVADTAQVRGRFTLGELLPHGFGPEHLK